VDFIAASFFEGLVRLADGSSGGQLASWISWFFYRFFKLLDLFRVF
jgi:hypothetical protein